MLAKVAVAHHAPPRVVRTLSPPVTFPVNRFIPP